MRRQEEGFTLIELVMVIVILGILAAVAVPRYLNLTAESQTATLNAGVSSLGSAIAISAARHRSTILSPTASQVLLDLPGSVCNTSVVAQGRVNVTLLGAVITGGVASTLGVINCAQSGSTVVQAVGTGFYSA